MSSDRISFYTILVDLHDEKYMLVHGLYGYVDLITKKNYEILNRWITNGVQIDSQEEREFYEALKKRKYILSQEEEEREKKSLIRRLKDKRDEMVHSPQSATFLPSYRCNFKCPYCYEKEVNRDSPIMTREQVDAVLSQYPEGQLKYVGLYGGEPFLPEHKEIIQYILSSAPDAEYNALTNGYYLKEFIPLLKQVKVRQIQVTFDGMKEIHNKTRILLDGGGSFDRALEGVKECIQNEIPVKIRMNLSYGNIESCYEFKEWLTGKLDNSELLSFDMQELFQYRGEAMAPLTQKVIEESQTGKRNIILDSMPRIARFLYNRQPVAPVITSCASASANRFYDSYGNIYSCFLSVGHPERAIGTYWPQYQMKETSILTRVASDIDECSHCKYIFLCGGGCPNPLYAQGGSIMKPNCVNMKYTIQYMLPTVYHTVYKNGK